MDNSAKKKKIIITGGHLTPALALLDFLLTKGFSDITWIGNKHSQTFSNLESAEYKEITNRKIKFYNLYYKECIDCCSKAVNAFENFNVEINYNCYYKYLFNMYVSTYYLNKENSKKIVDKIQMLINKIPQIKNCYLENKIFYDLQFSYSL